jgi:hypothetical protein
MSITTDIPVTITPEAAAHVAMLEMQHEFEMMVSKAKESITGLRAIDVSLAEPYDYGDDIRVIIDAFVDERHTLEDRSTWEYRRWKVSTFSPDVFRHFTLLTAPYEAGR